MTDPFDEIVAGTEDPTPVQVLAPEVRVSVALNGHERVFSARLTPGFPEVRVDPDAAIAEAAEMVGDVAATLFTQHYTDQEVSE